MPSLCRLYKHDIADLQIQSEVMSLLVALKLQCQQRNEQKLSFLSCLCGPLLLSYCNQTVGVAPLESHCNVCVMLVI